MTRRLASVRRASGAALVLAAVLATAGCGEAELPACGDDEVAAKLAEQLDDQICLLMPMNLHFLARDLTIEEAKVTLSAARTVEIFEKPARKRCQAKISITARLRLELIGPMPGRTLTLDAAMDDQRYNYGVQREDEGALYVGIESKEPVCFALDRLTKSEGAAKEED